VVGITNNSWSVVAEYEYDAYGNFLESGSDVWNTRLYTGREYDREIGLYYLRARYYSADLWRFISRDPIGIADDVNLYAYVGNSPVIGVDLRGRGKTIIFWWEDYYSYERLRFWDEYNFKYKAEAFKKYLINEKRFNENNIVVADGTTFEKWQYALQNNGNIANIIYYGHSWPKGLYLSDVTPEDHYDENTIRVILAYPDNPSITTDYYKYFDGTRDEYIDNLDSTNALWAHIYFYSCKTWLQSNWIAQKFADHFQWDAYGAEASVIPKQKLFAPRR